MITQKPGQFVRSGGVRINFKSHLKFYPTPAWEGIELRSKQDRTINPRVSPDIGFIEQAYTSARPPHDVGRTPGDNLSLIFRSFFDLNSIPSQPRCRGKKTSAADRTVLNFVTHQTADGSYVSSLPNAWRSDTLASDRIICD
ncbi:hypothetical protein DPMN_073427 [Dreissena polymorpha]|uniref:Uncharacterized protein n=1 Tax=Dreissena polymorpha TaxID=45954 RepID=A0A9D4BZ03_DREPO|nr:hypothetical protein DPMN_073427 [Dreissena polymorpha]